MNFKETISIGPFSMFFTNINREMKLPPHSHFAEVHLSFLSVGTIGFPVFEKQYNQIKKEIRRISEGGSFRGTNEFVARTLFEFFSGIHWEEADPNCFKLVKLKLRVRGVPDKIGHADGFAEYKVEV